MRLLITRPEPDASLSSARLEALGHDVLIDPVLVTHFDPGPLNYLPGDAIVITSKNGLRALLPLCHGPIFHETPLFTVGDATASLARDSGFQKVYSASGNVDNLVTLISGFPKTRLHYICGKDRRGGLENKLRTLGWQVEVAERYHTDFSNELKIETISALTSQNLDGILLYSQRSALSLQRLIAHHNISYLTNIITYFCLAKSITTVFDTDKGVRLVIADTPTEQSLFAALEVYSKSG